MKIAIKRNAIVEVISSLFILLFVYTAVSKLMDFDVFKGVLSRSPLIGDKAIWVAVSIPTIELIISALLFFPRTRLKGLYAATILMILFTLYIGYMLKFSPFLPCQCGGVIQKLGWKNHIYFNSVFVLLGFIAIWLMKRRGSNWENQGKVVMG